MKREKEMTPAQVKRAATRLHERTQVTNFIAWIAKREDSVRLVSSASAPPLDIPAPRAESLAHDMLVEIDRELKALGVEVPA